MGIIPAAILCGIACLAGAIARQREKKKKKPEIVIPDKFKEGSGNREWVCQCCGLLVDSSPCPHCGHERIVSESTIS